MIVQRREFANYLRENSGVKAYRISSKVPLWLCRDALLHLGGNEFAPAGDLNIAVRYFNI